MEHKQQIQGNYFGRRLEQLLLNTNLKSATVAAALNYDVSYISKWITGKALPSRKNVDKVLGVIADLVLEQSGEAVLQRLMDSFGVTREDALREVLEQGLRDAYFATTGQINENQYVNNAALRAAPRGKFPLLDDFARALDREKDQKVLVLADLFALDRVSKLQLAGIEGGHFRLGEENRRINMDYIIDLRSLRGDSVYDVILLIHMMTHFSHCDFRLFYSDWARDKLVIAVQDAFAGVSVMASHKQFLCTTSTRDKKTVEELYDSTRNLIEPDKQFFFRGEMENMLLNHEYFRNLLSQQCRWLVGHVTEHFVPRELFRQLSQQCFPEDSGLAREAERAWLLAANVLKGDRGRFMFYHLALVDFVLSGELDFFNRRVILEPEQRREVLQYLRQLVGAMAPGTVKLVREGFSDDFKYITNPCLFLSDAVPYLRLENKRYRDNLLLIKDEQVKKVFDGFFETIWHDRGDMVLSDHEGILEKLDSLIETAGLM